VNAVAAAALFDVEVARFSSRVLECRGWEVLSRTFPLLEIVFRHPGKEPLLLIMKFDGWNAQPPSAEMATPDRRPLTRPLQGGPGIFHVGPHPATGRPFICMAGVREYHTHPSHIGDLWDAYRARGDYDIGGILTRIWNGWLKTP
jgi:hypothetical protein